MVRIPKPNWRDRDRSGWEKKKTYHGPDFQELREIPPLIQKIRMRKGIVISKNLDSAIFEYNKLKEEIYEHKKLTQSS